MRAALPSLQRTGSGAEQEEFLKSGAWRTMSYQQWLAQQGNPTDGRSDVKPDGTVDGLTHAASRDEIISRFADLIRPSEETEEQRAAREFEEHLKGLGDLGKRAAGGDGEALNEAVRRSIAELQRASDPLIPSFDTPGDFLDEFPVPLDTSELITLCDETTLWRSLPEEVNDSLTVQKREITQLEFASGSASIAFPKGECPEDFVHDGANRSWDKKHIGVSKNLSESDILASRFSIARGYGMREIVGGFRDDGLPGEGGVPSLLRQQIADLKAKEMLLGSILTMNGWDQLLVDGSATVNPLEFDGIATQITAANGARANTLNTGTFNVTQFDQFLQAGCAHPDALIGHPTALAAISLAYFGVGSQTVFYDQNQQIVPGLQFGGEIVTSYGRIRLIGDNRFPRADNGDGTVNSTVYPVKMRHNGEDLISKITQIPLSAKDVIKGCTAIKFEVYAVTGLMVRGMCAQSLYNADFQALIDDGCTYIHPNAS